MLYAKVLFNNLIEFFLRYGKGKFDVESINPFLCTHLVFGEIFFNKVI